MIPLIARLLLARPKISLLFFAAVTAVFASGIPHVKLETIFSDLLPTDDPMVEVYKDHPNFGSPLTMTIMVKRKDGDIFNPETLSKIWQLTRDIDLVPGVDHTQILSIATEKARYSTATPYGIDMRPLMDGTVPQSEDEIANLRARVDKSPNVRTFLISSDLKATLISATFIEHKVDWGESFNFAQNLVEQARDEQHEVYLTGQPALIGWVYRYEKEMAYIAAISVAVLCIALWIAQNSLINTLPPILTSAAAAIWAFGFVGHLRIPIEPLLLVVPLLLVARSFSHGVQFTARFQEFLAELGDHRKAAHATLLTMAKPSVLSIVTDVLGICVVVAAPIPAMVNHAIFCGFWALWLIPTGVLLAAPLLAVLSKPNNAHSVPTKSHVDNSVLQALADFVCGPRKRFLATGLVFVSSLAWWQASQIQIGNPVPGSNILWPDSEFNVAVKEINAIFPGTNTLELVIEAIDPHASGWNAASVDAVKTMRALQLYMEKSDAPPTASLSFADYLSEVNRLFNGGHSKWLPLDPRERALTAAAVGAMMGASSTAYSHVVSPDLQHGTISLWYPDNTQDTIDAVLRSAQRAVKSVGESHDRMRVRLGTGTIAIQEAINQVVERYHHVVVGLLNFAIFILVTLAFRSAIAGLILLIPVNFAHLCMIASMKLLGVGLDINSMIVAAIGLGVGIDYGIYLVSRIRDEQIRHSEILLESIKRALKTSGRSIAFTASIMAIAILPLYLLSGLRFVADMGLLIIAIMGINMVSALIVLPTIIALTQPAFLSKKHRV